VHLPDFPEFGSASGGGRYEDLAGRFTKQKLPAVGASIGISRLMTLLLEQKLASTDKRTPAQALVTVYDEESRPSSNNLAEQLRKKGVATEVFYKSSKLGKQIEYAEKKGIAHVFFLDPENVGSVRVKSLVTQEQQEVADITAWCKSLE
jgi:histidyl-tRNA synthetase